MQNNRLLSLWKKTSEKGLDFHVGPKITFGELRDFLKKFKEAEGVNDDDLIDFVMFKVNNENPKAPEFDLMMRKNTFRRR